MNQLVSYGGTMCHWRELPPWHRYRIIMERRETQQGARELARLIREVKERMNHADN